MNDDVTTGGSTDQPSAEPQFVYLGQLTRPHGLKGEMRLQLDGDYEWLVVEQLETVFVGDDHRPYTFESLRLGPKSLLVAFNEVPDRNTAETLRGLTVVARVADLPPLADDEYYVGQIVGLNVVTDDGLQLGVVSSVIFTGANDVYVVTGPDGKDVLLPNIDSCVLAIDLAENTMRVHLMDGLLDT